MYRARAAHRKRNEENYPQKRARLRDERRGARRCSSTGSHPSIISQDGGREEHAGGHSTIFDGKRNDSTTSRCIARRASRKRSPRPPIMGNNDAGIYEGDSASSPLANSRFWSGGDQYHKQGKGIKKVCCFVKSTARRTPGWTVGDDGTALENDHDRQIAEVFQSLQTR